MEQTRIRECRRERRYWKEKGKMSVVVWVLLRFRGSLDYARDDGTRLRVDTRVDINPLQDFRYTLKRSICAVALDMPKRASW